MACAYNAFPAPTTVRARLFQMLESKRIFCFGTMVGSASFIIGGNNQRREWKWLNRTRADNKAVNRVANRATQANKRRSPVKPDSSRVARRRTILVTSPMTQRRHPRPDVREDRA